MNDWPHAPPHRLCQAGSYMVTASTWQKALHFRSSARRTLLQHHLLHTLQEAGWRVQAWAVFANHYHVIAVSPDVPATLSDLLAKVHMQTAAVANEGDGTPGRKVWFQYRETALTLPRGYYARLRYVHENAVHHRLVRQASDYPWCSAGWLEQRAAPAYRKLLASFKIDRLQVGDDFEIPAD